MCLWAVRCNFCSRRQCLPCNLVPRRHFPILLDGRCRRGGHGPRIIHRPPPGRIFIISSSIETTLPYLLGEQPFNVGGKKQGHTSADTITASINTASFVRRLINSVYQISTLRSALSAGFSITPVEKTRCLS